MNTAVLRLTHGGTYTLTGLTNIATDNLMYAKHNDETFTATAPNGKITAVDMREVCIIEITPEG